MKTVKKNFPVQGMGCAACVARVEKALQGQKGVQGVAVSLASNSAQIDYDPGVVTPGELRKAVQDAGYDMLVDESAEAEEEADRRRRAGYRSLIIDTVLAAVIAVAVMVISFIGMHGGGGGIGAAVPWRCILLAVLAGVSVFWCGRRFIRTALRQAAHGSATMDTLVALSTVISLAYSLFNICFPEFLRSHGVEPQLYFESCSMIVAFILVGRVLEERAKQSTTESIRALVGMQPAGIIVLPGQSVTVRPGERVPADGEVTEGSSYIDESLLTGEPMAVSKHPGDKVFAGTINGKGAFTMRAEKVGSDTMLSAIIRMVRDAQGSKARIQLKVDKVAAVFVPVIIGVSLLTLAAWWVFSPQDGLTRGLLAMVSVLVIACPCSLGLATPTALIAAIGKGATRGILIKDADSLQTASQIDTVVLDKTGTITEGHPAVSAEIWNDDSAKGILLAMERLSEHPVAEAVVAHLAAGAAGSGAAEAPADAYGPTGSAVASASAPAAGSPMASLAAPAAPAVTASASAAGSPAAPLAAPAAPAVTGFRAVPGQGICAEVDGVRYFAGNSLPAGIPPMKAWEDDGSTLVYFHDGSRLLAALAISDRIKEGSAEAVSELRAMGIETLMLTGDSEQAARRAASRVGITQLRAAALPADKLATVEQLQAAGHRVAMVGDGINDSAALARSDLSVAMGHGSDIAMNTSMATIVSSDLRRIPELVRLSTRTQRIIRQNLFWAFFYNILAVPAAALGLLTPMIAAACMALSSVCVVTNSLRLKR